MLDLDTLSRAFEDVLMIAIHLPGDARRILNYSACFLHRFSRPRPSVRDDLGAVSSKLGPFFLALALMLFQIAAAGAPAASSPFQPLSAVELTKSVRIVQKHFANQGLPVDGLLFPGVALAEPAKAGALDFLDHAGPLPPRLARVEVIHLPSNRFWVAIVNLDTGLVSSLSLKPPGVQAAISASEFIDADLVVHANPDWQAAIRRRGLDPDQCYVDVWAPGDLPTPGPVSYGSATRLLRCLAFYRGSVRIPNDPPQNPYDRPVEGVVVTLDMNAQTLVAGQPIAGRVIDIADSGIRPVSTDTGNATQERPSLKPLSVVEPQGPNYDRTGPEGRLVQWQKWQFFVGLHPREGLILYDVRFAGRRVAYRLALSEIYVPYGIGDEGWVWRTAFDIGEYWLGQYAQALEVDRDVPSNAQFIGANFATDTGGAYRVPNAVAIYEQFDGFAWTRTDPTTYRRDTRGARSLTTTWNAWIGNYIYGFDWVFHQDGSIEVAINLTGTTLNRGGATREGEGSQDDSAPLIGEAPSWPGSVGSPDGKARVRAPNHQHFFNFRLDLDVDGVANAVATRDVVRVPPTPGRALSNAFAEVETLIPTEGGFDADPSMVREWEVRSTIAQNALGLPTAYALHLPNLPPAFSDPAFPPLLRAQFATKPFWVTRYKDGELYAAGDHPNQGSAGEGLPTYANSEPFNVQAGEDVVVWVTLGHTHIPRPEDYPVMPTERLRFKLLPHGFHAANPDLDLPK